MFSEKAVFAVHAHVFQIDPETKKKWLPSSKSSVHVAYYHDPTRKTYRIIAIDDGKVLERERNGLEESDEREKDQEEIER